jgi:hypothetical protein
MVEVEPLAELRHRENLVVAMRPAQAREIVEHRFRQIAFVVVLHDADRAMPLRQFLAIVAKNHRQVRIARHLVRRAPAGC